MPRSLDKLILNHKPALPTSQRDSSPGGSGSPTRSSRNHHSRHQDGRESSHLARIRERENPSDGRTPIIPVTTASGTDVTQIALLSTTANAAAALTSASSFSKVQPFTPLSQVTMIGRGVSTVTDDSSVLPVPSHVVLNHLSTSAIRNVDHNSTRNGVIAVGSTVRYREKVLSSSLFALSQIHGLLTFFPFCL